MSATQDFLQAVLPTKGYYCLAKPYQNGGYGHQVFETVEQLAVAALTASNSKTDIFYAVGSLRERKVVDAEGKSHVRTHANILAHKSLFVDLDCGSNKDYPSQAEAVKALQTFCRDSGWFKPTYINSSGKGIHAYWVFDKELPSDQWKQLADRFKVITKHFGLRADPVCTSDKARVLRVPGTFNWKNPDEPKPVKILREGDLYSIQDVQDKIKFTLREHEIDFKKTKDELPQLPEHLKKLFADKVSNLQQISEVNLEPIYAGCAQMARVREIGGPVGYGLRSCAASIIKLSSEQDYSVLWANDPNPDLVESQTHNMIVNSVTDNPSTCERFESFNQGGCDSCQHHGKIKSPILLGKRILDLFNEDDKKTYEDRLAVEIAKDVADTATNEAGETTVFPDDRRTVKVDGEILKVFSPPKGYTVAANGHVMHKAVDEDGQEKLLTITDFTIMPIQLFKGNGGTDMCKIYAKSGINDPIVFTMATKDAASSETLKKVLAGYTMFPPGGEKSTLLYNYMISYIKHLQNMIKSTQVESSLGWTDDTYTKFITPEVIVTPSGSVECFIDDKVKPSIAALKKKGSFEEWKSVIDFYAQDGYEDYAFGHLTAYGSLIFPFSGQSGAIISMIGQSGSGKSTILKSINSVYGEPKNFLTQNGTTNAQMNRLAIYRNYAVTYDEITNIDPARLSDLAYAVSQGKSKLRLDQNSQERDTSKSNWQLIMACTGNANLTDRLSSHKIDASPEALRIFEYYIHRRDAVKHSEAREIFEKRLDHNYGHAGEVFIKYMVANTDKIHQMFDEVLTDLEQRAGTYQKERFWLAIATANIVGGMIAGELGLHSFDMDKISAWVVTKLQEMRGVVDENVRSPAQIVSEFINNAANKALVLEGGVIGKNGKLTDMYPVVEPSDQLWVRIEAAKNLAYIDRQRLKDYLTKGGSDYNTVKRQMMDAGVLMNPDSNKVLSANSNKAKSGSTKCWLVRLDHKDMVGTVVVPTLVTSGNLVMQGDQRA